MTTAWSGDGEIPAHPGDGRATRHAPLKTRVSQLAIAGDAPAFGEALHVGRPNIGDRHQLWQRINDLLDRRWLTNNGAYVKEFECRVASLARVRHCVAMCNGTVALEVAIRALGLRGEVLVPSYTFAATAHALLWQGIMPIFCDVNRRTHTIDVRRLEERITPRTTGILGVHLWGNACEIDELVRIADRHGLKLLFDAAHAFATSYRGRPIGAFGNAEVFSFHATKFVNTFEGGAVVTNDDELADSMRVMRNLGFRNLDEVACVGTNAKMTEVAAAMGLTNIESLDAFIAANYTHYLHYRRELAEIPGITLLEFNEAEQCNYQYIVVEVDQDLAGLSRNDLVQILRAENVLARRYFFPGCHRLPQYRDLNPDVAIFLPETERLAQTVMCLPTGSTLDPADVDAICQIVRLAVTHAADVRELLSQRSDRPDIQPPPQIPSLVAASSRVN
jgi:dTDP-4-amino-4,6-dideoxygalactose transaminase